MLLDVLQLAAEDVLVLLHVAFQVADALLQASQLLLAAIAALAETGARVGIMILEGMVLVSPGHVDASDEGKGQNDADC